MQKIVPNNCKENIVEFAFRYLNSHLCSEIVWSASQLVTTAPMRYHSARNLLMVN
jgi:hypothetical protein